MAAVERAIEACAVGKLLNVFNAAVYQFCPEAADVCHVESLEQLSGARQRLELGERYVTERGGKCCAALEVCKATTDVTQVQTDIGNETLEIYEWSARAGN